MTSILVDPQELSVVASTLRSVAAETAAVGTALSHCAACTMPADAEPIVNQIVATADAILDELARRMQVSANDLSIRAGFATNDSLTTATVATTAMTGFGVTMPMMGSFGTPQPGIADLTGGGFGGATVGGLVLDSSTTSPFATTWASAPAWWSGPNPRPFSSMFNPATTSQGMMQFASGMDGAAMKSTSMLVLPSRADMEKKLGRTVTLSEYSAMNIGGFDGNVFAVSSGIGLMRPALG